MKKEKVLSRKEIMDLCSVKEYWLSEDEQKLVDNYRTENWKKAEDRDAGRNNGGEGKRMCQGRV